MALDVFTGKGDGDGQPVNNFIVREAEDELVYHAVDSYCSRY
jgi:hypothetical protein